MQSVRFISDASRPAPVKLCEVTAVNGPRRRHREPPAMIALACLGLTPPPPRATAPVSRRAALAGVGPALLGAGVPALLGSPAFAAEADDEKNIYRLPAGSR